MAVFGRQLDFDLAPLARIASCLGFNLVESVEASRLVLKLACLKVGRPGPQIWWLAVSLQTNPRAPSLEKHGHMLTSHCDARLVRQEAPP